MKSLADDLPPEFKKHVHPDWRKNEAEYWAVRTDLLSRFRDQWIGFANGSVVASGRSPVEVFHAALDAQPHAFVTCVGREDEPCRFRRMSFRYNIAYGVEPLPQIGVEYSLSSGVPGIILDQVIPDTGADTSLLPWADCRQLQLNPAHGVPNVIGGVGASMAATMVFRIWVRLDGQEYPCKLQADLRGQERILGRDVLNRLDILFRGPAGEPVVNP